MRRQQATTRWELERALRRQILRRGFVMVIAGIAFGISVYGFLVLLFSL